MFEVGVVVPISDFVQTERQRATCWKGTTAALPEDARDPGQYRFRDGRLTPPLDFCLPRDHAPLNLLPGVRDEAMALFEQLAIPWHDGIAGGPSNHLLDSQVQCVNALGQMVTDPDRIIGAFGPVLGTAEVLEIEPGRFLTFEFIGDTDFFGEGNGRRRTRGSKCTSVDAAFLHRTGDGLTELALVEWKYTESCRRRKDDAAKDATRRDRYFSALSAPDSPVRADLVPFDDLLDEPLYQLMRQQLLAHELEKARAFGADRVRVIHVLPSANDDYQASLHRNSTKELGDSVSTVWQALLRRPDRFVSVDSAVFLDPGITSAEYVARYGP